MFIRIGYDIELGIDGPNALIYALRVCPDRRGDLVTPEVHTVTPRLIVDDYTDAYGNLCHRVRIPTGVSSVRLTSEAVIRDSGLPDPIVTDAVQHPVSDLPPDVLQFLLPSRYCEVDSELMPFAWNTFGHIDSGWATVQAVVDWVHDHITFDYQQADRERTALRGYRERVGVCRDFTHLAVTLCRCLNIPTRYCTGYLGDIGVPAVPDPMDFSAWFEVFLGGTWHTFDARHNARRIGRVVIAHGHDAADVPIAMTFGPQSVLRFDVFTDEVDEPAPLV